jgi:predicted RNase H-like HicB family nuclease
MKANAYIVVTFIFKKEGKKWTAYCKELGTASFGRSLPEALRRIKEAVLLHLNTLEDVGECERFLAENNVSIYARRPKKSELTVSGPFDINTFASPYIYPIYKESLNV